MELKLYVYGSKIWVNMKFKLYVYGINVWVNVELTHRHEVSREGYSHWEDEHVLASVHGPELEYSFYFIQLRLDERYIDLRPAETLKYKYTMAVVMY